MLSLDPERSRQFSDRSVFCDFMVVVVNAFDECALNA